MLAYVADLAAYELLCCQQPEARQPRAVAGFSVREFAALMVAGVISYEQGLVIVKARAEAMQRWVDSEAMAAVAIFGLDEEFHGIPKKVDPEDDSESRIAGWNSLCLELLRPFGT